MNDREGVRSHRDATTTSAGARGPARRAQVCVIGGDDVAASRKHQGRMYVDSCSSIHCVGTREHLQNQRTCRMTARGFRGGPETTTVMGDLYVVLMAKTSEGLEPRIVVVKDVYLFTDAPRLLLSFPRLSSKGCELFISKEGSHLQIPMKDQDPFRVPVLTAEGTGMPYVRAAFMGTKKKCLEFYQLEVAKTHWHLNAVETPYTDRRAASSGVTSALSTGATVGSRTGEASVPNPTEEGMEDTGFPVGVDTERRVLEAAKAMVSSQMFALIRGSTGGVESLKAGIISVGAGTLDGFSVAARVLGVHVLGGFEINPRRKELHEKFHGVELGFDAKSPPREYLRKLDTRAQELGVAERICVITAPCQPWSTAGRQRGAADPRVFTVDDVMRVLSRLDAKTMVFENVPSVPSAYLAALETALERAGYHVTLSHLDASTLGNAQVRTRLFMCAMQRGPCPLRKVAAGTVPSKSVGDFLDEIPSGDVFSNYDFDEVEVPEGDRSKPILVARFRGWQEVQSHWPGLGFSIHSRLGKCPVLRACTLRNRDKQPAGPLGTVLDKGRARRITVPEACRIQGFNSSWLKGVDEELATQVIGESVSVEQSGGVLASILAAMLTWRDRSREETPADQGLIDDFDASPRLDMVDHDAKAKNRVKTSSRGVTRREAHNAWGHCGRDMLDMLPILQQFVPHTHYYRDKTDWRCEACDMARTVHTRGLGSPVRRGGSAGRQTSKVGDLVHIDPMAPQRAFSLEGHTTAMVLIDDYSGFPYVKLMAKTVSVKDAFRAFCKGFFVPKRLRCDNACADMLHAICEEFDIVLERIVPHAPHQNGRVERIIGLLQERARIMREHSGVPIPLNLHAIEYAAIIMRFIPQAANGHKTAYELANGKPHRKPGPIVPSRVFGCMVVTSDKQMNVHMDKLSNRAVTGIFIGLAQADRLDSNCRAIKVLCLSKNRVILADPVDTKFVSSAFPFRVMRSKSTLMDEMVRFRVSGSKTDQSHKGIVIAYEAPLYTVLLQTGRLVRGDEASVLIWKGSYSQRNSNKPVPVPVVESNSLDEMSWPLQHALYSIEARGIGCAHDTAYDDEYDAADWASAADTSWDVQEDLPVVGGRGHPQGVPWPCTSRNRRRKSYRPARRKHSEGDLLLLPPRSIAGQGAGPFVGLVVSSFQETSMGQRTYLRGVDMGDRVLRGFESNALEVTATRVKPRVEDNSRGAYARATGQEESRIGDVHEDVRNLAFHPRSESNVLEWAAAEHRLDGGFDSCIDTDLDSTKEFERPPARSGDAVVSSVDGFIRSLGETALNNLAEDVYRDPQNDAQADKSEYRDDWRVARQKELDALIKNEVMSASDVPKSVRGNLKVVSAKWVYKKKPDKFKARLVIRGFTQVEGDNTFDKDMVLSPTAHGPSVRLLIAVAVEEGRKLGTFDVANAFQQGEFIAGEVIHVRMPKNAGGGVRRLLKPLYGLKQASRSFSEKLHVVLTGLGFVRCMYESCLYIYEEVDADGVTQRLDILLHVDDGLYSTTSERLQERKFSELGDEIEFTDVGELLTYLGVDYTYDKKAGYCGGSSESYLRRSFARLGLGYMLVASFQCKECPYNPSVDLCPCDDDVLYEEGTCPINLRVLVGVLSYAAATTRPDLSYIVNALASCVNDPRPKHVEAAYHCFSYVAGTISMGLAYTRKFEENEHDWRFTAYSDADWASNTLTRRSRTGVLLSLCGAPIIWKSCLQATIALSTTEAEYNALVYLGCEILYIFRILGDMGKMEDIVGGVSNNGIRKAMPVKVDNVSTIRIAENPFNMRRTRHIEIRHMKVLEWIRAGLISLEYVPSADNLADFFTKAARRAVFVSNRDSIMSTITTRSFSLDEKGLMSYDVGGFDEPAGAKPADSPAGRGQTESVSAVMGVLHRQMIDGAGDS